MGRDTVFFCWDACVLIEHFCQLREPASDRDERLAGIDGVLSRVEAGDAKIIVPVVWRVELLDVFLTKEKKRQLDEFMQQTDEILGVAIGTRIAEKAHDIRNKNQSLWDMDKSVKKLEGMDCLYPATAIVCGAKELHTFDPHLLRLNGNPSLDGLIIKSPKDFIPPQKKLF